MSFISTRTRRPKHRAIDAVASLRDENRRLLTQVVGAKDYIALMEHDLAEAKARQTEAELVVVCLAGDLDDLKVVRAELVAEVAGLRAQLAPYLAADANANAITLPDAFRDTTDGADQATTPIDVRPLWAALNIAGPVIATAGSTNPAAVPAA